MKSENTVQRIKKYIDYKGISVRKFEESMGFSNGSFASQYKNNKTIGVDKVEYILQVYSDINPIWLLTGKGTMLRSDGEPILPTTPSTNTSTPSDTVVLRLMEKLDEKDAKIDLLQSELRQKSEELAALKAKYSEELADNPVVLKTAKPASTKKRSSQPDADSATSANAQ